MKTQMPPCGICLSYELFEVYGALANRVVKKILGIEQQTYWNKSIGFVRQRPEPWKIVRRLLFRE